MCARLSRDLGLRVGTIDVILGRACAIGLIDSRTGVIAVRPDVAAS